MLQKRKEKNLLVIRETFQTLFFFRMQREESVKGRSVCRRSGRSPLCVTLSCVITSRIIGSVGGNSKRGYGGQSDSEEKV